MSSIDIANQALTLLGGQRITSFADGTTEAAVMNVFYAPAKRWVLRAYPWNCASVRVLLAEKAEKPINRFKFCYALPTDSIRIFRIYEQDRRNQNWKVEGGSILTDAKPAIALYAVNVAEGEFDSHVESVLVHRLAQLAAYAVTQSNTVVTNMKALFKEEIEEARTTDSLEASSEKIVSHTLTFVRSAGGGAEAQYVNLDETGLNQPL